ncbi:MAG: restriction endonuclease [Anaerolineae bacterium]|nr:restriction endonuclease [Anaerolineae bacterium]
MSRRRRYTKTGPGESVALLLTLLAIFCYNPLVAWWNNFPPEIRFLLGVLLIGLVILGVGITAALVLYRRKLNAAVWQRAMSAWRQSAHNVTVAPHQQSARHLSPDELETFAGKVYAQMGYRVKVTGRSGDHGIDVHLVNPQGQVEIVQCKQWNKPVGEPQVRDLLGAMSHVNAARAWLWAPGGFSAAARQWAKKKPIVLVDNAGIGRLLESAYGK